MKTPRLLLELDCDGIACSARVQVAVPADVSIAQLSDAAVERIFARGGGAC